MNNFTHLWTQFKYKELSDMCVRVLMKKKIKDI